MNRQTLVAGVVIGLWVLALVEQDRREALRALLAQNPELRALIEQIKRQVR